MIKSSELVYKYNVHVSAPNQEDTGNLFNIVQKMLFLQFQFKSFSLYFNVLLASQVPHVNDLQCFHQTMSLQKSCIAIRDAPRKMKTEAISALTFYKPANLTHAYMYMQSLKSQPRSGNCDQYNTNATNVFILNNQKFCLVAIMATFKTFKPCLKSSYNALQTLDH